MSKTRILRGSMEELDGWRRIIVDDGQFNEGWVVKKFVVAGDNIGSSEVSGLLALHECKKTWDFSVEHQIAWASARQTTEAAWGGFPGVIDTSHVVIRDLYVSVNDSTGRMVNYLIELERVSLSDDQAVMALLQEVQHV